LTLIREGQTSYYFRYNLSDKYFTAFFILERPVILTWSQIDNHLSGRRNIASADD